MRSYGQFCALARALDVLGERWTLLLVRELMLGPRRFGDLVGGLPGIAPNLLTDRLRALEGHGIIERTTLPPPAGSRVYQLTERGQALRPVVRELAGWGMEAMEPPRETEQRRPAWYAIALEASFQSERARDVNEDYAFLVDGTSFYLRVRDSECLALSGEAPDPAFLLRCSLDRFLAIATGSGHPTATELEGDRKAFDRFQRDFALPAPVAEPV